MHGIARDEVRIQIFFPYYFRVPEMYAAFPRGTNNISRPYFIGMTNALSKTGAGAARLFNFHNKDDYALNSTVSWPVNQSLKPDDGWSALFHGTNTDYTFFDHNTQLYLDAHKLDQVFDIYAYIAQARSKALGCAEDPTHNIQGDIGGAVNLNLAPFNYGNNTYEHSAEFNSINMNRRSYWWQVLSTFSITNNLPNL